MMPIRLISAVVAVFVSTLAIAAEDEASVLLERLKAARPDIPVLAVHETPVPNVHALELPGGTFLYGTADGKYLFSGDLYELNGAGLAMATMEFCCNDEPNPEEPDPVSVDVVSPAFVAAAAPP